MLHQVPRNEKHADGGAQTESGLKTNKSAFHTPIHSRLDTRENSSKTTIPGGLYDATRKSTLQLEESIELPVSYVA